MRFNHQDFWINSIPKKNAFSDAIIQVIKSHKSSMAGFNVGDSATVILWIIGITFVGAVIFFTACISYLCIISGLKWGKLGNDNKRMFEDDYVYVKRKSDYHKMKDDEKVEEATLPF